MMSNLLRLEITVRALDLYSNRVLRTNMHGLLSFPDFTTYLYLHYLWFTETNAGIHRRINSRLKRNQYHAPTGTILLSRYTFLSMP